MVDEDAFLGDEIMLKEKAFVDVITVDRAISGNRKDEKVMAFIIDLKEFACWVLGFAKDETFSCVVDFDLLVSLSASQIYEPEECFLVSRDSQKI